MNPEVIIPTFDDFLAERNVVFECVAIGASVLGLLGIIDRHTRDVDVLDPELPGEILDLAKSFAERCREEGVPLANDWLNNGPMSLRNDLPPDCLALAPTEEEIGEITPWLEERDTNPDWPEHVRDVLRDLRERLGYGI